MAPQSLAQLFHSPIEPTDMAIPKFCANGGNGGDHISKYYCTSDEPNSASYKAGEERFFWSKAISKHPVTPHSWKEIFEVVCPSLIHTPTKLTLHRLVAYCEGTYERLWLSCLFASTSRFASYSRSVFSTRYSNGQSFSYTECRVKKWADSTLTVLLTIHWTLTHRCLLVGREKGIQLWPE